ncbi:hypothetical protein LguiB_025196 [Lonicera macranthoides]
MTKDEDFKLLKVQTCTLRVNIHCEGCKNEVKKLLRRIEGVYQTTIDAEQQRVTVSGNVDSETLIKKFLKAGKHAELWSSDHNKKTNNQNQKQSNPKDDNNNNNKISQKKAQPMEVIEPSQNQQKLPNPSPQEEGNEEEDEDGEEDEVHLTQPEATTDPKNPNANGKGKGKKKANGNRNGGKPGNPNQSNGGIDQKVMAAAAMKLKTPQMVGGGVNIGYQGGGVKKGENEMNSNVGGPTVLGGSPTNAMAGGGLQMPPQPNKNGCPSFAGYPVPNVMGVGTSTGPPPSMVMNFSGHALHQQQPQVVMYQMAPPMVPPNTGYYSDYNSLPYSEPTYSCDYFEAMNDTNEEKTSGNGCSIM